MLCLARFLVLGHREASTGCISEPEEARRGGTEKAALSLQSGSVASAFLADFFLFQPI